MWTTTDLRLSVKRLGKLRDFLGTLPPEKYDHDNYLTECGAPSCALGWATVALPELLAVGRDRQEFVVCAVEDRQLIDEAAGQYVFRLSRKFRSFLFAFFVWHHGVDHLPRRGGDNSIATTLRRLDAVLFLLRNRLTALEREEQERKDKLATRQQRRWAAKRAARLRKEAVSA